MAATERKEDNNSLLDLERELTCSICTDILFQPLTLLDCLHTFCGGCLKEWFAWQAAAAAQKRPSAAAARNRPYTCPSCREPVRGTKADWRLNALMEGYLKANPGKGKTEEEKAEARAQYHPGEDVLPEIRIESASDSEDERLLAQVRDLSMAGVDPQSARRRAERTGQQRPRRQRGTSSDRVRQEEVRRGLQQQQQPQHDGPGGRHVEHQSSLRSLLSGSDVDSQEMQQEILQSIYSEGLLDGIDVDNLTPEQEDELTERIAEAYRRRQRQRERSRNPDRRDGSERPPSQANARSDSPRRQQVQTGNSTTSQPSSRARPPISRPHLFEQTPADAHRSHRRSTSANSRPSSQSTNQTIGLGETPTAARSATDLSNDPSTNEGQRTRQRVSPTNARSTTDPETTRTVTQHARDNSSSNLRPLIASPRTRSRDSQPPDTGGTQTRPSSQRSPPNSSPQQEVRPIHSTSHFASESAQPLIQSHPISCTRCGCAGIQHFLHYNCSKCHNGNFNLCLACYRGGHGCEHWFGFGFRAMERWRALAPPEGWPRTYDYPHILLPRRWEPSTASFAQESLQEGAFCESCHQFADIPASVSPSQTPGRYWYCEVCLEGAWGFCNSCVLRGKHCTHPLLPLIPVSSDHPSSKSQIIPIPHLPPQSHALLEPLDPVSCDECSRTIPAQDARYHCYQCSDGDYDICTSCYSSLTRMGKVAPADGPHGWRRCLQRHRMAVLQYRPTPYGSGFARITIADPVGGWRLKDDHVGSRPSAPPTNPNATTATATNGHRFLATWSRFPEEGNGDELVFPRNAEIREGEVMNEDWSVGVYMGAVGVFPSNHVRRM